MISENLQKVTLNLRTGDWEFLRDAYASRGMGPSIVVRKIISREVDRIQAKMTPMEEFSEE